MSGHLDNMDAPAPAFSPEDAETIAAYHFGITGRASALVGERDLNFRITDASGSAHTLKIWNATQDPAIARFLAAALLHVARTDPGIPVPRVIPALDGRECIFVDGENGGRHPVCMLSWLPGVFLRQVQATVELKAKLGHSLGRLDRALSKFRHPAEERNLLWDVCKVTRLRSFVDDIRSPDTRELVQRTLDDFEAHVEPSLGRLRHQVIHNDLNPDNVLIDPEDRVSVAGIIDFGDMMRMPLVCDLAVAAAYQLSVDGDPMTDLLPLVIGYHQEMPLHTEELAVLLDLVRARLLCTLLITTRMAALHPENADYLLADNPAAERKLMLLDNLSRDTALNELQRACA